MRSRSPLPVCRRRRCWRTCCAHCHHRPLHAPQASSVCADSRRIGKATLTRALSFDHSPSDASLDARARGSAMHAAMLSVVLLWQQRPDAYADGPARRDRHATVVRRGAGSEGEVGDEQAWRRHARRQPRSQCAASAQCAAHSGEMAAAGLLSNALHSRTHYQDISQRCARVRDNSQHSKFKLL